YTLTVPSPVITAALHTVTVTDHLPEQLALVGAPAINGGVNASDLSASDGVTVTFERIDATLDATIAFTTVVRNLAINQAGVDVVNTAQLAWQDGAGAPQPPLVSNAITTTLIEPVLAIDKSAQAIGAVEAGDLVTYTLTITHAAPSNATAHNLTVVDHIPAVFTYKAGSLQIAPPAATSLATDQLISATFSALGELSPTLTITYVVTVDSAAEPSTVLTNTATLSYTSLPGTPPEERTGTGIDPNDYLTDTAAAVTTGNLFIRKTLAEDRGYTIGEAITYTIEAVVPTGLTRLHPRITDTIPAGLRYDPTTSFLDLTTDPAFTLPGYAIIQSPLDGGDGALTSTVSLAFADVISNTTGQPATIAWSFRLIVADVATANAGEIKPNNAYVVYLDANDVLNRRDATPVEVPLVEPDLKIDE
ncbi:MAG: isopeptide-forming domain-containing fimbrial protein, partial [Caldilineaceae bacterium]|nr:isopeptide-forming domain-containing fimbrial protein [Caldilineaceae bacterium]